MKAAVKNDYETRNVNFSVMIGETNEQYMALLNNLNIEPGLKMLDLGGGYGFVLEKIIELKGAVPFHYDLVDGAQHQLNKGKTSHLAILNNNRPGPEIRYLHQNALELDLPQNYYDVVLCKMFIHEIPEAKKQALFNSIYSVIKPGGSFVIWAPDLSVADKDFYSKVIFEKDKLAGYTSFLINRHFSLNEELFGYLKQAGFTQPEKKHSFFYDLHTINRLQEEFGGDENKLSQWNDCILKLTASLNEDIRKKILVAIDKTNIHLRFNRAIFKAIK